MGASLATGAAGLSPIVGALLAGVLIAETEYRGEVEVMMAPFYGLGLGIFLITVGMSVDLRQVADQWELILAPCSASCCSRRWSPPCCCGSAVRARRSRPRTGADGLALRNHPDRAGAAAAAG